MLALPPVAPAVGWRQSTRLPRDHYIRLEGTAYSVHPSVIGRGVEVIADPHRVRVLCDGRTVAEHQRVWAKHQTITAPEHRTAAAVLRRRRLQLVSSGTGETGIDAAPAPLRPAGTVSWTSGGRRSVMV